MNSRTIYLALCTVLLSLRPGIFGLLRGWLHVLSGKTKNKNKQTPHSERGAARAGGTKLRRLLSYYSLLACLHRKSVTLQQAAVETKSKCSSKSGHAAGHSTNKPPRPKRATINAREKHKRGTAKMTPEALLAAVDNIPTRRTHDARRRRSRYKTK